MNALAPIALFVYNRLSNTRRTVGCLKNNALAPQSELYIFSDGGRDEKSWKEVNQLRRYLHTIEGFKEVHIIEREQNFYLERNIIEGISQIFEEHSKIIVLEDDICASPVFLEYMNGALDKYETDSQVMHVSGFTNLDIPEMGDTYFTHHMSGWGWATWKDRWVHFVHYESPEEALKGLSFYDKSKIEYDGNFPCLKSLYKTPIPWDICWEIAIYKHRGLCLHPTQTLVQNIGIGRGTHFSANRIFGWYEYDRPVRLEPVKLSNIPISSNSLIEAMYKIALKDHGMRYNWFGKVVRTLYLPFKGKENEESY